MKIFNTVASLLLLLPLSSLIPNPSFSIHESTLNASDSGDLSLEEQITQSQKQGEQEQKERILQQQQQQNWSTYEDPILGIQFEHPAWWEKRQTEDSIKFYPLGTGRYGNYEVFANILVFLPPLDPEMNTTNKLMRQVMSEIRTSSTQDIKVNRTSTIGADNIPAYRVDSETVIEGIPYHTKRIDYFSIDNGPGTGYVISLNTEIGRFQEDVPLFEKMVESFKIVS